MFKLAAIFLAIFLKVWTWSLLSVKAGITAAESPESMETGSILSAKLVNKTLPLLSRIILRMISSQLERSSVK